jgi:hypothetical protein
VTTKADALALSAKRPYDYPASRRVPGALLAAYLASPSCVLRREAGVVEGPTAIAGGCPNSSGNGCLASSLPTHTTARLNIWDAPRRLVARTRHHGRRYDSAKFIWRAAGNRAVG